MLKPDIRRESRFFHTQPAFDAAVNFFFIVLSRLDRGIQSISDGDVALEKGAGPVGCCTQL